MSTWMILRVEAREQDVEARGSAREQNEGVSTH